MSKLSLEEQFMRGMQNLSVATQSDLDDSFFETDDQKQQEQEERQRQMKKNKLILQELRNNLQNEEALIGQFQQQFNEVRKVTRNEKDTVLNLQTVQEIKKKVAEQVGTKKIQLAQQTILKVQHLPKPTVKPVELKPLIDPLEQKRQKMFQQRELVLMMRADAESLKYEQDYHMNLLYFRSYQPIIRNVYSISPAIHISCPEPVHTYTNLTPQVNNESNILSKHSKVLAMRRLAAIGKTQRIKPVKISQRIVKLQPTAENKTDNPEEQALVVASTSQPLALSLLRQHYSKMSDNIKQLKKISEQYKPRFMKQHLESEEKGYNASLNESNISLQSFIDPETSQKQKQLRITFEQLSNLNGIQQLLNIEYCQLQYNQIANIKQIKSCQKLIEIDLSNNKIPDYLGIEQLKWLRYLNLSNNVISNMTELPADLEFLNLSHNKINQIDGIQSCRHLRTLLINHNQITQIDNLNCYFLDQLNISYNKLSNVANLDRCLLLRRVNLSNNRIKSVSKLYLMFLNELHLENNQIEDIDTLVLPSLETAYLTNNKINSLSGELYYLPNIKTINIDKNKLTGFAAVWKLLKSSNKINILKYDDNEELLYLPEKVRECFESLVSRKVVDGGLLNQHQMEGGVRGYFASLYGNVLKNHQKSKKNDLLSRLESKIRLSLLESGLLNELSQKKDEFSKQRQFVWLRSVRVSNNLLEISDFLLRNKDQIPTCNNSSFYRLEMFRLKMKQSLHKLQGMLIKWKYQREKRRKYYIKNVKRIEKGLEFIKKTLFLRDIKNYIRSLYKLGRYGLGHEQAIKIQKVWRGYRVRKRFRELMSKIRVSRDDEDFLEEDIDLDFFSNPVDFDFKLKIPENFHFDQLVIRPQIFKKVQELPPIKEKQKEGPKLPPLNNNFMPRESSHSRFENRSGHLPPIHTKEEEQRRLMDQWGFKDPATVAAMQMKMQRKKKARQKELQKNMTATQRLEKFKKL